MSVLSLGAGRSSPERGDASWTLPELLVESVAATEAGLSICTAWDEPLREAPRLLILAHRLVYNSVYAGPRFLQQASSP